MLMYDNNALMWSVIIRIKTNYYTDILHCFVYYHVLYLYRIDVNKGNLLWRENKTTMISLSTSNTEDASILIPSFLKVWRIARFGLAFIAYLTSKPNAFGNARVSFAAVMSFS